jgi:hypothetical protein
MDARKVRSKTLMSAIAPAALFAGVPLAFVDTRLAIAAWVAIAPAQAVADRWFTRMLREARHDQRAPDDPSVT